MKKITLIALVLLFVSGCGQKWLAKHCPQDNITIHDTTIFREVVDSTIFVDGPVLFDTIHIDCDSNGNVIVDPDLEGDINVVWTDHGLVIKADCPDKVITIKRLRQYIRISGNRYESRTIKEKYIPAIYKYSLIGWIVVIIVGAGYLTLRVSKHKLFA